MTTYKRNCLIIFAACCMLLLLVVGLARASGPVMPRFLYSTAENGWHADGYVVGKIANDAYYDPGIGVLGELYGRWYMLEGRLSGNINAMHKRGADSGYTWWGNLQGRGYPYGPFYVAVGYRIAGYSSKFSDGTEWTKHGGNPGIGLGYNNGSTDVNWLYYLKETGSPNQVQFWQIELRQKLWTWLWLMTDFARSTWDQGTERWSGYSMTFGLGVRW